MELPGLLRPSSLKGAQWSGGYRGCPKHIIQSRDRVNLRAEYWPEWIRRAVRLNEAVLGHTEGFSDSNNVLSAL